MNLVTERLSIQNLSLDHAEFMFQLMNSPKWKEFIGDRKIESISDASGYIQKINETPNTDYWVLEHRENKELVGIVTFMKRNYLDHFDIGFALLPNFFGKGFAFEASSAVLNELKKDDSHQKILAVTVPTNLNSSQLLERLDFAFDKEVELNGELLNLYSIS